MNSRICSLVCLLRAGQRTIPFEVVKRYGELLYISARRISSFLRRLVSCDSFEHCINKSPDLRFLILLGSPAILIMVLLTMKGEREEIVSSSSE